MHDCKLRLAHTVRVFIAIAMLLALLPTWSAAAQGTSASITIDLDGEAESMDPNLVYTANGEAVAADIFDYLFERDYNGQLVPMLAQSYSVVDPTTIQLVLRQGVSFTNGEPFNADSVIYSIKRLQSPEENSAAAKATVGSIADVQKVDDYTVNLILNTPDATVFDGLTQEAAMLPPQYYSSNSEDFLATHPVGS